MQIDAVGTLIELLIIVVIGGIVARRLSVPYPIIMVLAGLAVGLVPWLPDVDLHPDIVFHVFLPLLVYHAGWGASWRSLKRDFVPVIMLAVVLVLLTAFAVAAVAPALLPTLSWPMAFILGAVVAPTDQLAVTEIGRRLKLRKRVANLLDEESLLNDATGLLAFQLGVAVLLGHRMPTITQDVGRLIFVSIGGAAIGIAVGFIAQWAERFVEEPPLVIASTVIVPFVAYFAAEWARTSGLLAVVVCALIHSRHSDEARSAHVRLESGIVWNTLGYVLNAVVFVLIGFQLPEIFRGLRNYHPGSLLLYAIGFSAVVIGLRLFWVLIALPRFSISERLFVGWSSMRGVVSLAAAMSLPLVLAGGRPFPQRPLILFLTAWAVFFSLVVKGLTIPVVIRRLGLQASGEYDAEQRLARRLIAQSALERLGAMHEAGEIHDDHYERAKRSYESRVAALEDGDGPVAEFETRFWEIRRAMLQAEREAALRLRREDRISDEVFHALQGELDFAEARLRPAEVA